MAIEDRSAPRPSPAPSGRAKGLVAAIVGVAVIGLLAAAALWALADPRPLGALIGFWSVTLSLGATGLGLLYVGARRLSGTPTPQSHFSRDVAVLLAIAAASVVAPGAMQNAVGVAAGVARGLVLETPFVANEGPAAAPASTLANPGGKVVAQGPARSSGKPPSPATRDALPKGPPGSTPATAAINDVVGCIADPALCVTRGSRWVAFTSDEALTGAWILFGLTFLVAMLIARAVIASRRDYIEALEDRVAIRNGDKPKGYLKRVLMDYPTWVAVGVYAAILIPATYLSVGSLVFLRTADAPVSDLQAWAQDLEHVEQAAEDDGVKFNGAVFAQEIQAYDRAGILLNAAKTASQNNVAFLKWRREYVASALGLAKWEKQHLPASRVADDKAILLAHYAYAIRDARLRIRPCLQRLSNIQIELESFGPKKDAAAAAAAARSAAAAAPSAPAADSPPVAKYQIADGAFAEVASKCQPQEDQNFIRPNLVIGPEAADANGERGTVQFFYGWLGNDSDASVLIVGLVGFGLFGSAIRMMGRPDVEPVSPEDLNAAELAAERAADELIAFNKRLAAKDDASEQPTLAKKRFDAANARAAYDRLRSQSVSDRNSIVIRRIKANGDIETVISGAAGKVFMQGLGAAFTAFLMAQASSKIITDGGHVSAWSILLGCFAGAVFAEEIWAQALKILKKSPDPAPKPKPVPVKPAPALGPTASGTARPATIRSPRPGRAP